MTFELFWQLKIYSFIFAAGYFLGMLTIYFIVKDKYKKD